MEKIKTIAKKIETKAMMRLAGVQSQEAGDHLLEVLGTIIIAVVILILFRKQITSIFNSALSRTGNEVNTLFGNV